ncbi:Leucine-rich repeat [Sesbania bispinosa]|nr:Leucine-rich repeat [Sesbania bispinosa]
MFRSSLCLLFLACILWICFCVGSSHLNKCAKTDREALLNLKHGFLHGRRILSSWKGVDCCKWKGVSCDNITGHVTILDLEAPSYFRQLGGKIDSSICELQHLTFLNLTYNSLKGNIPKCIGSLGQLIELKLGNNELVSVVPHTLANLSNLQTLNLFWNHLVANELEWVSHLHNLRYLDLSNMNLSRAVDWLSSISKIPSLSQLHLHDCFLPQVNLKSIPHLNSSTSLKILDLSTNNFNSSMLSRVVNISKVLTDFYFSHNSLHNITDGLANMTSLQYLDLSFNELEGNLPKSFQSLHQLKWLGLNFNRLSGQLSDFIGQLRYTQTTLMMLDLSDNPFSSGPLPNFSWLSSLEALSLRNTNIVGPLPQSFGHLPYLAELDLSFNKLSGPLPLFEVTKLAALERLDLSHNQLNGSLPHIIGQLSGLNSLSLSSNKLNGVINESHLSNLSKLVTLDVAQNSLSFNLREIPQCLSHISALSNIMFPRERFFFLSYDEYYDNGYEGGLLNDKAILAWKGENREYGKNLGLVTSIDLSYNQLVGEIPQSITTLVALANLNLSGNHLTGFIPNNIGHMEMLESLDLSRNHLRGRMPESFSNLTFLSYMNLSFNNLSGEIPLSTQLQSFDASTYVGNSGLCGLPLTNHCPGDETSPTGSLDKHVIDEDEDEFITLGFYVSLGLGFFVGFWGVCGTLVIKTSWRHAYFQFFNNMNDLIYVRRALS